MKDRIIVDTSALISYFIDSEQNHQKISQYIQENPNLEWIIISTVFSELMTWLRFKIHPKYALPIGSFLREKCNYHLITWLEDEDTRNIYHSFSDKKWSYTDCSLLAVSKSIQVPLILTVDHHFNQMKNFGIISVPEDFL